MEYEAILHGPVQCACRHSAPQSVPPGGVVSGSAGTGVPPLVLVRSTAAAPTERQWKHRPKNPNLALYIDEYISTVNSSFIQIRYSWPYGFF